MKNEVLPELQVLQLSYYPLKVDHILTECKMYDQQHQLFKISYHIFDYETPGTVDKPISS